MSLPHSRCSRQRNGFTLIEVMITLAVLAILSAMAYPTFIDAIRKGRRADAYSVLALGMQAQERYRTNNVAYTESLADIGASSASPEGLYVLSVVTGSTSATGYTLRATANNTRSQHADTLCRTLQVAVAGGNIVYSSLNSAGAANASAPDPCWSK